MQSNLQLVSQLSVDDFKKCLMELLCGLDRQHRLEYQGRERDATYMIYHQALGKMGYAIQACKAHEDLVALMQSLLLGQFRPVTACVPVGTKIIHDGEFVQTLGHDTNLFLAILKAQLLNQIKERVENHAVATGNHNWAVITRLNALQEHVRAMKYGFHIVNLKKYLIASYKMGDVFRQEFDACQTAAQLAKVIVNRTQYGELVTTINTH